MNFTSAEREQILAQAAQILAARMLETVKDIDDLVTIPMEMAEQTTGLGATQIGRRMTVRNLTSRKRGVSLKVLRTYLRNTETPATEGGVVPFPKNATG